MIALPTAKNTQCSDVHTHNSGVHADKLVKADVRSSPGLQQEQPWADDVV